MPAITLAEVHTADVLMSHGARGAVVKAVCGGSFSHAGLQVRQGFSVDATTEGVRWIPNDAIVQGQDCAEVLHCQLPGWDPKEVRKAALALVPPDPADPPTEPFMHLDAGTIVLALASRRKVTLDMLMMVRLFGRAWLTALEQLGPDGWTCSRLVGTCFWQAAGGNPALGIRVSATGSRAFDPHDHEFALGGPDDVDPDPCAPETEPGPPIHEAVAALTEDDERRGAYRDWLTAVQDGWPFDDAALAAMAALEDALFDGDPAAGDPVVDLVEEFRQFSEQVWALYRAWFPGDVPRLEAIASAHEVARQTGEISDFTVGHDYPAWLLIPREIECSPSFRSIGWLSRPCLA